VALQSWASSAEASVHHSFCCLDKENVKNWNLKNAVTCGVLADPVTNCHIQIVMHTNFKQVRCAHWIVLQIQVFILPLRTFNSDCSIRVINFH